MTPEQLYTLIMSDEQAAALAVAGADADCAARCSEIAPQVAVSTMRTYRTLSSSGGVGVDITRRLIVSVRALASADPLVDEIQASLKRSQSVDGIDINDPGTQGMLDYMAGLNISNGLTSSDVTAIKAQCLAPKVITTEQVSAAMLPHRTDGKVSE